MVKSEAMKIVLYFIFVIFSPFVLAQMSTSNNDLRGGKELFSIEFEMNKEKQKLFLSKTVTGDHTLQSRF